MLMYFIGEINENIMQYTKPSMSICSFSLSWPNFLLQLTVICDFHQTVTSTSRLAVPLLTIHLTSLHVCSTHTLLTHHLHFMYFCSPMLPPLLQSFSKFCSCFSPPFQRYSVKPRPSNFIICSLNIRSVPHPLHSAALTNLIKVYHPNLFCFYWNLGSDLLPLPL